MNEYLAAVEALADAWASIDGKLDKFREGKTPKLDIDGHYAGYMTEALELMARLEKRGFQIIPIK